ncbi:MAG: hypothetical protein HPY57_13055 [Ignavibacteria bacterium]|nr:hypothetical protein [Ignavibacteria bacterium]
MGAYKRIAYYLNLRYPVRIKKIPENEGGGYCAWIPTFGENCLVADGQTWNQAIDNLNKLKEAYIIELFEKGEKIPEP